MVLGLIPIYVPTDLIIFSYLKGNRNAFIIAIQYEVHYGIIHYIFYKNI